eukprot:6444908-Pyramimonas_sp.AAC.1
MQWLHHRPWLGSSVIVRRICGARSARNVIGITAVCPVMHWSKVMISTPAIPLRCVSSGRSQQLAVSQPSLTMAGRSMMAGAFVLMQ